MPSSWCTARGKVFEHVPFDDPPSGDQLSPSSGALLQPCRTGPHPPGTSERPSDRRIPSTSEDRREPRSRHASCCGRSARDGVRALLLAVILVRRHPPRGSGHPRRVGIALARTGEVASSAVKIEETLPTGEIPQQSGPGSEHPGDAGQTGSRGEEVPSVPVDPEFDLAPELGDVVRCVDLARPTEILTVRITGSDPLALELIAAGIGDQVQVRSDGGAPRTLQVLEIIKHEP